MEPNDINFGADENCVLQYLSNFPGQFISETEIARRADGRGHYLKDVHWPHNALAQLVDASLLEADGEGKYRLKTRQQSGEKPKASRRPKKFIAPQLRDILEHSSHKIDLSRFT